MRTDTKSPLDARKEFCDERLNLLRGKMAALASLSGRTDLCIYVTGSFGRGEAGEHSDLDLFFLHEPKREQDAFSRIDKTLIDADLIRLCREMGFPEFSGDGEYLEIHALESFVKVLGSPEDDASNVFTARMLLLLESAPLFNEEMYAKAVNRSVAAYFQDYHDHDNAFRPIFLVNDILRYWKTLCLNYEHSRNRKKDDAGAKNKSHLKNFKLKFSRLVTCFSLVAWLCQKRETVGPSEVAAVVRQRPLERLLSLAREFGGADLESTLRNEYAWFLEITDRPRGEQLEWISDKDRRGQAFGRASQFGDHVFALVQAVAQNTDIIRYLVV